MLALTLALSLFACGGGNSGDNGAGASGTQYTVRILPADGVTVNGENSVKVNAGGTAVFEIEITEGYAFQSVSDGVYDAVTGTLTVSDVQDDIRVRISVVKIDVDAESFVYKFHGYVGDTSTAEDGRVEVGSRITVSSEMGNRDFLGWSFGTFLGAGAGNILPTMITSALGIAIYGMFVAIVVPVASENKPTLICVLIAIVLSCIFKFTPVLNKVQSGFVIIICAVIASIVMAIVSPIEIKEEEAKNE